MKTKGKFGRVYLRKEEKVLKYNVLQFHIHSPSEHQIDGKNYDAEIHVVFEVDPQDRDDSGQYKLAVVAFLFDSSSDQSNDFLESWDLTREEGEIFEFDLDFF